LVSLILILNYLVIVAPSPSQLSTTARGLVVEPTTVPRLDRVALPLVRELTLAPVRLGIQALEQLALVISTPSSQIKLKSLTPHPALLTPRSPLLSCTSH